jgi:pilus assembly protein Flp/PilA
MEIMKRLVREEEGQGLVEYVLIVGVVVGIAALVSASGVGTTIGNKLKAIVNAVAP